MKKIILLAGTVSALLLTACGDKENTPVPAKTRQQLIQQNWTLFRIVIAEFDPGNHYYDTTMGSAGNYSDFNADGHVYYCPAAGAAVDTNTYEIINEDSIVIKQIGYTIINLTEGSFKLYNKTNYTTPGTGKEEWVEFVRPIP